MKEEIPAIIRIVTYLEQRNFVADTAIILGTGLGGLINEIDILDTIPYGEISGFPVSTVESHQGRLIKGRMGKKEVLVLQGRFHHYEGYTFQQITLPVRVLCLLGIQKLFISNAAGAVNLTFQKGDLMLINDHINFMHGNPLIGANNDQWGPRFPDMSEPYSKELNRLIESVSQKNQIKIQKGVYLAQSGPALETRAEYRMMRTMGADVVGMSTVPEVMVANHMGVEVAAISVVTDMCDPDNLEPVSLEEIIAVAKKAEKKLTFLLSQVIKAMA